MLRLHYNYSFFADGLSEVLKKLVELAESNDSTKELVQAAAQKDVQKVQRALSHDDVKVLYGYSFDYM